MAAVVARKVGIGPSYPSVSRFAFWPGHVANISIILDCCGENYLFFHRRRGESLCVKNQKFGACVLGTNRLLLV